MMILPGVTTWTVGEPIPCGMGCGVEHAPAGDLLVQRTTSHVLVGYAAEDLIPGDTARIDMNSRITKAN